MITQVRLKELLDYNPDSGLFTRLSSVSSRTKAGDISGCINAQGYIQIKIDGKIYKSHRLVWLYIHGELPVGVIDHINGIKTDNRLVNIRSVTCSDNSRNRKISSSNKSGCMGVYWGSHYGKWYVQITVGGKRVVIGSFSDKRDAVAARKKAEVDCGYHSNHGRKS